MDMENRRQFLKKSLGFIGFSSIFFLPLSTFVQKVYGKVKRIILPKRTKLNSLIQKNPKSLDTRNLEITPIENFETMGLTDYKADLSKWRLIVEGAVQKPLRLTYEEMKELPSMESEVLLICPGFFAIYGRWKGIDMKRLLKEAKMEKGATHVTFYGPEGTYEKVERFPIDDILAGKVFLAYGVNGKPLPRKHGFPLRIVARDRYGGEWVKYVYKATVEKILKS
ncbi:oxidoreductase molybdopterin binding domain protein [delta proteobacterium NaphS2]|nr:oxidoreductase molybdopterin binding domain protein [delta proteobacterium NaphS2]